MTASAVAEAGYRGMMRGKLLVVPGLHNKFGTQSIRIAPRRVVLKVVRRLHPVAR
jgi:short-subunit dehydrogenase